MILGFPMDFLYLYRISQDLDLAGFRFAFDLIPRIHARTHARLRARIYARNLC